LGNVASRAADIAMQLTTTNARLKSIDEQLSSIDGSLLNINDRQLAR
jgi:hypothetical protein